MQVVKYVSIIMLKLQSFLKCQKNIVMILLNVGVFVNLGTILQSCWAISNDMEITVTWRFRIKSVNNELTPRGSIPLHEISLESRDHVLGFEATWTDKPEQDSYAFLTLEKRRWCWVDIATWLDQRYLQRKFILGKRNIDPVLFYCWPTRNDSGPTLKQHLVVATCLLVRWWTH